MTAVGIAGDSQVIPGEVAGGGYFSHGDVG